AHLRYIAGAAGGAGEVWLQVDGQPRAYVALQYQPCTTNQEILVGIVERVFISHRTVRPQVDTVVSSQHRGIAVLQITTQLNIGGPRTAALGGSDSLYTIVLGVYPGFQCAQREHRQIDSRGGGSRFGACVG